MNASQKFARRVFFWSAVYGFLVIAPQYFMENRIGRDTPPITHPEHFYGFVGVALAWQIAFLIISRDPGRYRPIMIAAVFEKFSFGISTLILVAGGRVLPVVGFFAGIDLCLGVLFAISYARLR